VGLSLARLDAVRDGQLWLSGVDLIDGTPVLDIKPYHPADAMPWELTRAPGTSATRIHF
jgi:tRNA (Thr-GGU) A37 N-methylase